MRQPDAASATAADPLARIAARVAGTRAAWKAPNRRKREVNRRRPVQVVVLGFVAAIAAGTFLLLLPVSATGSHASFLEALFTTVSALCVTGLIVVDTPTHWTTFGHVVILVLIQIGGFGVMTLASVLALMLSRHLGLETRFVAATATRTLRLGDVAEVLRGVFRATVLIEGVVAVVLALRWLAWYDVPLPRALWLGVFHSVSAFNNAGFALFTDNLMGFATDPWICLPVAASLILGGLGFPVLFEVYRHHRHPRRWTLLTKVTLAGSGILLALGTVFILLGEWANPGTLGPLSPAGKLLAGFFQAVVPRTAGFNSVDIAQMNTGTWLGMDVLMFIGGGSSGTAGGIKVTTLAVLSFAVWSELRSDHDVTAFGWRLPPTTIREALTVSTMSMVLVVVSTVVIAMTSPFTLDQILFEVVSAFATVGLSTGITADLVPFHQFIVIALMFVGRLGPVTLGTALAMRSRESRIRHPHTTIPIG
ncbi:MAG: TrkH family potassium uptake protein [Actinomycetales bacterium]|nr:TrkH family potassium uptake protein [Actinomycetales bacterium]